VFHTRINLSTNRLIMSRDFRLPPRCRWVFNLLCCYAAYIDSLSTFRKSTGPIIKGQDGSDRLSRNIGKHLPRTQRNRP
jgi:hypothetical protein